MFINQVYKDGPLHFFKKEGKVLSMVQKIET